MTIRESQGMGWLGVVLDENQSVLRKPLLLHFFGRHVDGADLLAPGLLAT